MCQLFRYECLGLAKHSIAALGHKNQDNFLALRIIAALWVIYGHSFAITRESGELDVFLHYNWGIYSGDIAIRNLFVGLASTTNFNIHVSRNFSNG